MTFIRMFEGEKTGSIRKIYRFYYIEWKKKEVRKWSMLSLEYALW